MRGSRTGVFVGCQMSETGTSLCRDPDNVQGYTITGCERFVFSNRISFALDLRGTLDLATCFTYPDSGPSFSVDTACSSSLQALQLALDAIREGQCEAAIVAGAHLTLTPNVCLMFKNLGLINAGGVCRSFDASGIL